MQEFKNSPKDWIKAGGLLGVAILAARLTRMPLATILSATPFLLRLLREAENTQNQNAPASSGMTRNEACLILGISPGANQQEIQEAHRRLIQKNHPDLGGTDYLASKINQARDILLTK